MVYESILWASDPLQSFSDSHRLAMTSGQLAGDYLFSSMNWRSSIIVSFTAGSDLNTVHGNVETFIKDLQRRNTLQFVPYRVLVLMLHSLVVSLKEGLGVLDLDHINSIPTERGPDPSSWKLGVRLSPQIIQLIKAFLFRQMDAIFLYVDISERIARNKQTLCPDYLFGMFFEGLASFYLARESTHEAETWITKGEAVLARMRNLSKHSSWNWENKVLLLEAECMYTLNVDGAAKYYARAIQSAHEHKFVHEEAISSELAGIFYCNKNLCRKALQLLLHSVRKYEEWGAFAVARRVISFIENRYGSDVTQRTDNHAFEHIYTSQQGLSKKRQDFCHT